MKFTTILLCVGLERFLPIESLMHRFNWFGWYVDTLNKLNTDQGWPEGIMPLLLIGLPLIILSTIVYISGSAQIGFAWVLDILLLLYCLGPDDIYRSQDSNIFWQANTRLFAVLFWFALCGPIGALLYRLIERVTSTQSSTGPWAQQITLIAACLDWLPVRLFTFIYALVGNFMKTAQHWLDHLVSSWRYNRELSEQTGRIALGLATDVELDTALYAQALDLIDRSLVVFLLSLLLITLSSLL